MTLFGSLFLAYFSKCHFSKIVLNSVVLLGVFMLSVIVLSARLLTLGTVIPRVVMTSVIFLLYAEGLCVLNAILLSVVALLETTSNQPLSIRHRNIMKVDFSWFCL
jgi:hypothetical protein